MNMKIYKLQKLNMKNLIRKTLLSMALLSAMGTVNAQITVTDFETFTLSPNSAYDPTTTASSPFTTTTASFEHTYDLGFSYWSGGFAYTNINDSITSGFTNLYGVRAYKGYTNSATYIVGQDEGLIKLTVPQTTVAGFYITNTTYAYKTITMGDMFARKFGDTTGTGSGTTIAQGSYPDYFKVIVKGYKNGTLKNDSVTVMLADFTYTNNAQDFILSNWQFVNTAVIGEVDSLQFFMRSSDEGDFGINTPLFFAIDNFTTLNFDYTALNQQTKSNLEATVYPNPFNNSITIDMHENMSRFSTATVMGVSGKIILVQQLNNVNIVDLVSLDKGVYFLELNSGDRRTVKKLIKN